MKLSGKIKDNIVGHVTFPFTNFLYNRRSILNRYHHLIQSEWYTKEQLHEIQLKKLQQIIEHASLHIPFYQKRFKAIGLDPRDIRQIDDLKEIPVLSRQEVIDHHKEMVDIRFQSSVSIADRSPNDPGTPIPFAIFFKHKLVKNTSSGSTGAPTVFYEDGTRSAINWAHELRLKNWFGLTPGAREARMTRLSSDYMPNSKIVKFRKHLWHQLLLPGVNLNDDDYQLCLDKLLDFKPAALWGFTSALAGLAAYIKKQGGWPGKYRPKVAVGWAAPVYEHEKKIISEAFQCEVTNIYGAREVGHIAGQCPNGAFHINAENMIAEQVPIEPGKNDKTGEIIITNIDILPMPFIRYRMGDIGSISKSQCACGRNLPILEDFLGRTGEIFITKSGRMISPNFWCRTFMSSNVSGTIRRFQIIYSKSKDLTIKIERGNAYSSETENYIQGVVNKNFSPETKLYFQYVKKIEPEVSGKYLMVINEENS